MRDYLPYLHVLLKIMNQNKKKKQARSSLAYEMCNFEAFLFPSTSPLPIALANLKRLNPDHECSKDK